MDLTAVLRDADFNVSLQHPAIARRLWEEEPENEELTKQIAPLQTGEAPLQTDISQLERGSQHLQLKLQILSQLQQELVMQLQSKLFEEERKALLRN